MRSEESFGKKIPLHTRDVCSGNIHRRKRNCSLYNEAQPCQISLPEYTAALHLYQNLDIEILNIQRVILYETSARLNSISHQNRENLICFYCVIHFNLQ